MNNKTARGLQVGGFKWRTCGDQANCIPGISWGRFRGGTWQHVAWNGWAGVCEKFAPSNASPDKERRVLQCGSRRVRSGQIRTAALQWSISDYSSLDF